jgi:hypothetical protein
MATAYPGALDTTGSQLRTDIASTDDLDASGKEHDVMHVNVHGATVALETKLGLTASNAVDGAILVGSAASTTAWTTTPTIGGNTTVSGTLTVSGQMFTHLVVETDATTTHAPAVGDENKYILTTHGTGITVTLPQNSAQAFAIGTTIYYERNGAGTLTFAAGTGATVTSKDSTLTCGDRYTAVCALKIGTNAWSLIGNIG